MSEIMRIMRLPAIDMMQLASENRRMEAENREMKEALEAAQAANAVLTQEVETDEKLIKALYHRAQVLQEERNDARHERNCLRARRDEAYTQAIAGNKREAKRWKKKVRFVACEALCLAVTILLLFVLGSEAASWIRYWMG